MGLHRPYIRQSVREEVEQRAEKNEKGQYLDANEKTPIEGKYDFGHKTGYEFHTEAEKAEGKGIAQEEFNEHMNNPDYYQIEDPSINRSHRYEARNDNVQEESKANAQKSEVYQTEAPSICESESSSESECECEDAGECIGMGDE